jgi:hypothetical protein
MNFAHSGSFSGVTRSNVFSARPIAIAVSVLRPMAARARASNTYR